jgi:hypothetical protein
LTNSVQPGYDGGRASSPSERPSMAQLPIALKRAATACLHCGVVGALGRFGVYKQALLEEGVRLVQAHVLREKDDIFHLTFQELADLPVGFFPDIKTAATPGEAFPKKGADMSITKQPVDNGVNSDALLSARTALTEAPEAAEFTWRSTCSWVHGTFSQSTVTGFSGLGQEHTHCVPYTFDAITRNASPQKTEAPPRLRSCSPHSAVASPPASPRWHSIAGFSSDRSRRRSRAA